MVRRLGQSASPGTGPGVRHLSFLLRPEGRLGEGTLNGFFGVSLLSPSGELFIGIPGGGRLDRYGIEERGGQNQKRKRKRVGS
jgi:hypothetical protein